MAHPSSRRPAAKARPHRYELYERAVQDPAADIALLQRIFRKHADRPARLLREDFCGTAVMACRWVEQNPENEAWAIDIDPEPLAFARERHVAKLSPAQASRLHLERGDVRRVRHRKVDVTIAFNFSYFVFRTRAELLDYFRAARASLAPDGILALDHYGGLDATAELTETRRCRGFTYVWEQELYLSGTGEYHCHIGFRFPDKTRIRRAFTYRWRYWHLTELIDALKDAGFRSVELYVEQGDADGEGNGEFAHDPSAKSARDCGGIICYVLALK